MLAHLEHFLQLSVRLVGPGVGGGPFAAAHLVVLVLAEVRLEGEGVSS